MARASIPTLLSLDSFARVVAANPVFFNQASAQDTTPVTMPLESACDYVLAQHPWQHQDAVSREEIAAQLAIAEREVSEIMGYTIGPTWMTEKRRRFAKQQKPEWLRDVYDVRGNAQRITVKNSKFIEGGQRKTTQIAQACITPQTYTGNTFMLEYLDLDSDTFIETARITLTFTDAELETYGITDENCQTQIKVYFDTKGPDPSWEIRYPKEITYTETVTGASILMDFNSWLFIKPELWEAYPTDEGFSSINISTADNFVDCVDVYREYPDPALPHCTFYWVIKGVEYSQTGLITEMDEGGKVIVEPYSYDEDTETWTRANWTKCVTPNHFTLYYRAGVISDRYTDGYTYDPVPDYLARAVSYMSLARLVRPLCDCHNTMSIYEEMREDLAVFGGAKMRFNPIETLRNPFGSKRGEVMAWKLIKSLNEQRAKVAAI